MGETLREGVEVADNSIVAAGFLLREVKKIHPECLSPEFLQK
jgi:hypothetical protein